VNVAGSLSRKAFSIGAASACVGAAVAPAFAANFAPATVNIINTSANDSFVVQQLIKKRHFLEDFNLTANTQNVSDGVKLLSGLLNNAGDIGLLTGFSQVFPAIENGASVKIIAGAVLPPDYIIFTANPQIKTLKDLEGKSVGTGAVGAVVYLAFVAALLKAGVDYTKINFVNIGSSSDVFKAIAAKKVDAGPAQHDFLRMASSFGVRALVDTPKLIPEFTTQGSFTTDHAIATKRDVLVRTLAAYGRAYRLIDNRTSQSQYVAASMEAIGGPESEAQGRYKWQWVQQTHAYDVGLVLSPERINYMQRLNVKLGIQKAVLPMNKVADMTIARDALKLLKG